MGWGYQFFLWDSFPFFLVASVWLPGFVFGVGSARICEAVVGLLPSSVLDEGS